MHKIDEELTWLLKDIKSGHLNYQQSVVAIKRIFANNLGFCLVEDMRDNNDTPF